MRMAHSLASAPPEFIKKPLISAGQISERRLHSRPLISVLARPPYKVGTVFIYSSIAF